MPYLRDVHDHLRLVDEEVAAQRDLLTTILEANMAVISAQQTQTSVRQNDSIRQLTLIATVFLPLTFMTGFFGQNFGWLVAHTSSLAAPFLVLGLGGLLLAALVLYVWLRRDVSARFLLEGPAGKQGRAPGGTPPPPPAGRGGGGAAESDPRLLRRRFILHAGERRRGRMAVKPEEAKAALVEQAIAYVRERLPRRRKRGSSASSVRTTPTPRPRILGELDLYGAALAHWHLLQRRRPGEVKVHAYTPTLEEHGWQSTHSVVEIVTDDMPFLVDSVAMALTRRGSAIHVFVHPMIRVRRDDEGRLLELLPWEAEGLAESLIHVEIDRQAEQARSTSSRRSSNAPSRTCAPRSRTGGRCASASGRSSRSSTSARPRSAPTSSPRRRLCSSG